MSTDARRVWKVLQERGIEIENTYDIELTIGKYYPNHVIQTIERVFPHEETGLHRARHAGWEYFGKPCDQLLSSRSGALRTERIGPAEGAERVYNVVRSSLLLSDFGFAELQVLTGELPPLIEETFENLHRAIRACKAGNARNIYYLRGVLSREAQTSAGRKREINEAAASAEARAWTPPEDYHNLDAGERAEVELDWQNRLKDIELDQFFNDLRHCND